MSLKYGNKEGLKYLFK